MGKDKGESENGEKWRGWGFAPIYGRRRGGGPVVSESPSELALEGVKKMKVHVVRFNHVRVFEMENGGHHRVHQLEDSRPVKFGRRKPPDGATLAPTRRRREWACAGASWVHTSFCAPQPHWISTRGCTIAAGPYPDVSRRSGSNCRVRFVKFEPGTKAHESLPTWLCWRNGGLKGASYSVSCRWEVRAH
ncbi:hypothetical protein GQ457_14G018240 [Hibiscus cannabinus]